MSQRHGENAEALIFIEVHIWVISILANYAAEVYIVIYTLPSLVLKAMHLGRWLCLSNFHRLEVHWVDFSIFL